jgi:hypothetical protein
MRVDFQGAAFKIGRLGCRGEAEDRRLAMPHVVSCGSSKEAGHPLVAAAVTGTESVKSIDDE